MLKHGWWITAIIVVLLVWWLRKQHVKPAATAAGM